MAPALRNPGFLASATDGMIKTAVVQGRADTPMPSFGHLGERAINDIVTYVRTFQDAESSAAVLALRDQPPRIVRESPYDLETTVERVKESIGRHNFFVGRTQTLDYGLVPKAESDTNQVVLYFCNIDMLNRALAIDPRIGMFLPCRVTVIASGEKVLVTWINPKVLSPFFDNAALNRMCEQMRRSYLDIVEESVL